MYVFEYIKKILDMVDLCLKYLGGVHSLKTITSSKSLRPLRNDMSDAKTN